MGYISSQDADTQRERENTLGEEWKAFLHATKEAMAAKEAEVIDNDKDNDN